jgi:glycosyltransferase involved in cell wall biosynthesis
MNFGCPSVAFSVGGIPEVVEHGVTGLLIPFGDTGALARSLEGLIEDAGRRTTMGCAGQKRARELFSAQAIVPQYEALYRRVARRES